MTDDEERRLHEFQRWTMRVRDQLEETGEYLKVEGSEFVYDILAKWTDRHLNDALEEVDDTVKSFIFRARDNVNAVGCILYLLFKHYHGDMTEKKIRAAVKKIVVWMAENRLTESCMRYEVEKHDGLLAPKERVNVLGLLPDEFYQSELTGLLVKYGKKCSAPEIIASWVNRGKVKLVSTKEEMAKGVKRYGKLSKAQSEK